MTANTDQKCPTIFVSDRPALRDSFEANKAYDRVVSAIVDIVRSPDNEGMSIGVEGSWGAGKSTLINLLRARLYGSDGGDPDKASGPVRLIAFDAWAHEGDPLRLTFLETIVDKLKAQSWIKEHEWTERLDIIAQRKEIKDSASDYGLTWFDAVIAFTFFLIPIGMASLNAAFREGVSFDQRNPPHWKLLIGILLCIVPPVLIFGKLLFHRSKENEAQSTRQTFLALLLNRTLSAGRTVVVKSPEPTSLEFEKQFQQLMSEALDQYPERRVVLVIDNLDRVQSDRAIEVWSTLQTFLQHRYYEPPAWLKQLYTIVLYDPARITERPAKDKKSEAAEEAATLIDGPPDGSMLDKSFQIRLEVPPPILSDWRGYLLDLLKEALPTHETEHHDVYRILAIDRHKQSLAIRELKLFVNQICAIHLQWQDTFPLKHVAYYVLLKRRQENIVDGLIGGVLPEPRYAGVLDESARDSLAALSFNVQPKVAYQLLLATPIQEALTDGDGDKLKELATKFESGFWESLENIVSDEWAAEQSEKVSRSILAIEGSELLKTTQRPEVQSVRRSLSRIAFGMKVWMLTPETAEGLGVVCRWRLLDGPGNYHPDQEIARLVEAATEGLFDRNPTLRPPVSLAAWLSALDMLINDLRGLVPATLVSNSVVKKIRQRLTWDKHLEAREISRLLEVLVELHPRDGSAGLTLTELAEQGQIYRFFNQVHLTGDHNACSWCILTLFGFASSLSSASYMGSAKQGYEALITLLEKPEPRDVQEFSKLLMRYNNELDILKPGIEKDDFLIECLKFIAGTPEADSFFTAHFILDNWSFLRTKLFGNDTFLHLLNNPELVEETQRRGFSAEFAYLYRLMVKNKGVSVGFQDWCRAGLERLTASEWELDLDHHAQQAALALEIKQSGTSLKLGDEFVTGIVASAENTLRDIDSDVFVMLSDDSYLLTLLDDEQQRSVATRIYELVKQAKGDLPYNFLRSKGGLISRVLTIDEESVTTILKPIIERRFEEDINWLINTLRDKPSLLEEKPEPEWHDDEDQFEDYSDPESINDLKRIVLMGLSLPVDSATPFLAGLARVLGFNYSGTLPPPPWTVENLGESLYGLVAGWGGYFDPPFDQDFQPPLGPDGILDE